MRGHSIKKSLTKVARIQLDASAEGCADSFDFQCPHDRCDDCCWFEKNVKVAVLRSGTEVGMEGKQGNSQDQPYQLSSSMDSSNQVLKHRK